MGVGFQADGKTAKDNFLFRQTEREVGKDGVIKPKSEPIDVDAEEDNDAEDEGGTRVEKEKKKKLKLEQEMDEDVEMEHNVDENGEQWRLKSGRNDEDGETKRMKAAKWMRDRV